MIFGSLQVGSYGTNCYIIADEVTKEAAIVDPGGMDKEILDYIEDNSLIVKYILLTHGHGDHIIGVEYIKAATGGKVAIGALDDEMIQNPDLNMSRYVGGQALILDSADIKLEDGDTLKLGLIDVNVIGTPGHTRGGVCYLVGDHLVSGDTLFAGSIGRTDLPSGDYDKIIKSIKDKLLVLPEETLVFPGHGGKSSIGAEKRSNPFLRK